MSLTATARSIPGTLRQDVLIDGHHRLDHRRARRLGGDGTAPAPHELFPAALAACIPTTLVMYARTKDWELGEVMVDVDDDNRSTPRTFEIAIPLGGDLDDDAAANVSRTSRAPVRFAVRSRPASSSSSSSSAPSLRGNGRRVVSKKQIVPPIPEFIGLVADSGTRLYACKATVDMFGLTMDDFDAPSR